MLMRSTDQYGQWQRISQISDNEAQRVAELIIRREALVRSLRQTGAGDPTQLARLTELLRQVGIVLPEAPPQQDASAASSPVAGLPSSTDQTSMQGSGEELSEENLLILDLTCEEIGLEQPIVGYSSAAGELLPLGGFAQALDFDLSVDPAAGTAKGWFIAEDRTLAVDAQARSIVVDGQEYPWDDRRIRVGEDDIYVERSLLAQWFPTDIEINPNELKAKLVPREPLPLQARFDREQRRLGLGGREDLSLRYPAEQTPYELFSFPIADLTLAAGSSSVSTDTSDYQTRYSLLAEGDIGYMGARVFVSGLEDDYLSTARIRLSRQDADSQLFGPLKASQIFVGDISPVNMPVLGRPQEERGVYLSNQDLARSSDFDTTRFEGNGQPGWDVELYRNNSLIGSQRVGVDGKYLFDEIEVFYGANDFRVVAYGPRGEERVLEEQSINVGGQMLTKNAFEYALSATEREKTLLGLDDQEDEVDDGGRFSARIGYGLTDFLSITGGVSSLAFDDLRHTYLTTGLSGTFASIYGQADYIVDTESGSGYSLQAQTALGPVNIKAKHEGFDGFVDEDRPSRTLEERNYLAVNGLLRDIPFLPNLSYTLSGQNEQYRDLETNKISARLGGQLHRIYVSNLLNWNLSDSSSDNGTVDGELQVLGPIAGGRVTSSLRYGLSGDEGITRYGLSGTWPLTTDLNLTSSLFQYTGDSERTSAKLGLDWDSGDYILTPSATYDSENGIGAFLSLSFSLGQNPVSDAVEMDSERRSGRGAATAFVYHDANNNQVFDAEDEALEDVQVVARQARKKAWTDAEGVAQIAGLTEFQATDIEVNQETLADPFWQPSAPGVAVVPRSGGVHRLEVPVVTTGEIDGTVFAVDPTGRQMTRANVKLELVDSEGEVVQTVASEYDGFYLFEKVFPGSYTLRVKPDSSAGQMAPLALDVEIGNDGTIARGRDILLPVSAVENPETKAEPAESLPAPPEPPAVQPPPSEPPGPAASHAGISIRPLTVVNGEKPAGEVVSTVSARSSGERIAVASRPPAPASPAQPVAQGIGPVDLLRRNGQQAGIVHDGISRHAAQVAPIMHGEGQGAMGNRTQGEVQPARPNERDRGEPVEATGSVGQRGRTTTPSSPREVGSVIQPFEPIGRPFEIGLQAPQPSQLRGRPALAATRQRQPVQAASPRVVEGPATGFDQEVGAGSQPVPIYGVHLASYRTEQAARVGLDLLRQRLNGYLGQENLHIRMVDLGQDKGVWFRVVCGEFASRQDADGLVRRISSRTDYAQPIALEEEEGRGLAIAALRTNRAVGVNTYAAVMRASQLGSRRLR